MIQLTIKRKSPPDEAKVSLSLTRCSGKVFMSPAQTSRVTDILNELSHGNRSAETELIQLMYPELHNLALRYMRRERSDHTLQPTALVHEVYLRIAGHPQDWQNRAHFFAVASRLMRSLLVDHARKRLAAKRGGGPCCLELGALLPVTDAISESVLDIDRALDKLATWDARQSEIVMLRFFGGLTEEEIAQVLAISIRTVRRDWRMAKAWLQGELGANPLSNDS